MNAEIEKNIKKFFKNEREFKRVYTKEECDAIVAFKNDEPQKIIFYFKRCKFGFRKNN